MDQELKSKKNAVLRRARASIVFYYYCDNDYLPKLSYDQQKKKYLMLRW